jgi:hypothetical protein
VIDVSLQQSHCDEDADEGGRMYDGYFCPIGWVDSDCPSDEYEPESGTKCDDASEQNTPGTS